MKIKNNLEIVWHIKDNELKKERKQVTKYIYDDIECAFIKSDLKNDRADCLVKDNNNEYWKLGLYHVRNEAFAKLLEIDNESAKILLKKRNLFDIFYEKISEKKYFNKCELEFISRNAPEMYEDALNCRNYVLKQNKALEEYEEKEKANKVAEVNNKFKERLNEIKTAIYNKQDIEVEDFIFYKDNDYYKGKTNRNCFLYLMDEYKLEFPLHIKSFINNKLVRYDFETQKYWYKRQKTETTINLNVYMNLIYENVKREYENVKKRAKNKEQSR